MKLYEEYKDARALALQWMDDHPYDWNGFIRKIEDAIPKDQAEQGRKRLAEQYPHGLSSRPWVKTVLDNPKDDPVKEAPDRWGAYFKEFVARYELSEGQTIVAEPILHEVAKRAARLDRTMADQIARVRESDGPKTAALVEEAFGFDIDDLFAEFQARLDALLTTNQRHKPVTPATSDTKVGKQIRPSVSASEISGR
ncbi:MAG: hypothetical protein IH987_01690 [Planctomycetes bacterium]|nr:hypothetical protein [Planctomycetota bacterium]